jgi:hypothetical protein
MKATWLGFFVALFLVASPAAAAPPDAAAVSARAHYTEGMKRYNLADYRVALDEFKQAYLAKPDPVFLFNIGQCQRQLADYGGAEKSYRAFLRESWSSVSAGQREQVEKLIAEMAKAQAEARSMQPPLGTQPPRDDAPERAAGGTPDSARIQTASPAASAGSPAGSSSVAARPDTPPSPGRTKKIAGLVVGIAGVAMIGAGIALGVLAKQAGDDLTRLNDAGGPFDKSKEQSGMLDQTLSGVMLGIGAGAVAVGVVVAVLGLREDRVAATRSHALVTPLVTPTSAGAALTLSF